MTGPEFVSFAFAQSKRETKINTTNKLTAIAAPTVIVFNAKIIS
jgi:hypothetical protein